ncbi:MAG: family intrarane metalloprotease [Myxococcales bacterium]|nr:family intrarane metalloprotease [Myxococcales bacterium]
MTTLLVVVLSVAASLAGSRGELPSPGQVDSHTAYAAAVKSAGNQALQKAVARYDAHLARFPRDAVAAIERCKLVGATLSEDEDEEDEGRGAMFDACVGALDERFPHSAAVAVYRVDRQWGADARTLASRLLGDPQIRWSDLERAHVYAKLAQQCTAAQLALASNYARQAVRLDPTLDVTRVLGEQLLAEGRRAEAIVTLSSRTDELPFELIRKAQLLADAGAYDRALWMIDLAKAQPNAFIDPFVHGTILEGAGKSDLARQKYAEQKGEWNRRRTLTHLFLLDVARGAATPAAQSYEALRDLGWRADPLGRHRLALAHAFPRAAWHARDLRGLAALLACILAFMLLPALWVAPIHYWSLSRRLRGRVTPTPTIAAVRWTFRHVWIASAAFLVVDFVGLYIFDYNDLAFWVPAAQKQPSAPHSIAACGLWSAVALTATLAALLLRRRDLPLFGRGTWSRSRSIGQAAAALGMVLGIAIVVNMLSKLVPGVVTLEQQLKAIREVYGVAALLLVVCVIAPLTEELVFRSVILDVIGRYMPLLWANAIQAFLFALAHGEPRRMPYLFALGFLAGRLRLRSRGLMPSMMLHAANNALVVLFMVAATTTAPTRIAAAPPPVAPELVKCARLAHDPHARSAAEPIAPPSVPGPLELNNAAWALAVDPSTSPACLRHAEDAVEAALTGSPDHPGYLDTKATVLYRQGRLDEAVDLERLALDLHDSDDLGSQLTRFLAKREARGGAITLGRGSAAAVKLSLVGGGSQAPVALQTIVVELGDGFPEGLILYARAVSGHRDVGLFHAVFGPNHARSYRLVSDSGPMNLPDDTRFDVALVDGRGGNGSPPAAQWWHLSAHMPVVDAYP